MSYCVNCGVEYTKYTTLCPSCLNDQEVPDEIISRALAGYKDQSCSTNKLPLGYPGEKGALALSLLISGAIALVFGMATFGILLLILIAGLIQLYFHYVSMRKNLIKVSNNNFKKAYNLSRIAAYRLKINLPDIFVANDPTYNAYATGFNKYSFMVLHDSLLRFLNDEELLFIIGHEMGHIKCDHVTWLMLQHPGRSAFMMTPFASLIRLIFCAWSVKSEYTADQAGLIACQNLKKAISALTSIASGKSPEGEFDIQDFIESKGEADDLKGIWLELGSTHPLISNRIKQLIAYAGQGSESPRAEPEAAGITY